jgi:hypothetical protein
MNADERLKKTIDNMLKEYNAKEVQAFAKLLSMPEFLPFDRYISTYLSVENRAKIDGLNSALAALECFAYGYAMPEFTFGDFFLGGHHTPLYFAELCELENRLMVADSLLHGSFHVIMSGVPNGSAMLLRAALESAVKGIFFEHMFDLAYREKFEQQQEFYKRHDVAWTAVRFYEKIKDASRELDVPVEKVLLEPNRCLKQVGNVSISFRHMIRILTDWDIFDQASNESQIVADIYSNLSQVVHSQTDTIYLDTEDAIRKMIETIDYILVGTLRTMKNLRPKTISNIRDNFEWNVLLEHIKTGQLCHTELFLNQQMSVLLQKKSSEWFEKVVREVASLDDINLTKQDISNLYSRYLKSKKTFERWLSHAF